MEESLDEYDIKIAGYFDNKMSPGEESAFMEELGDNAVLRARFEEELQMQAFFYQEDNGAALQNMQPVAGGVLIDGAIPAKKSAKIFSLPFKTFMAVAASLLVIAAGTVIYFLSANGGKPGANNPTVAQKTTPLPVDTTPNNTLHKPAPNKLAANIPHTKDTLPSANKNIAAHRRTDSAGADELDGSSFGRRHLKSDSAAANAGSNPATSVSDTGAAYRAFTKFYTVYQSNGDDPAAANRVYLHYTQAKYRLVIDAKEIAAQTGALADSTAKANGYLSLYKGLSYLAFNRPQNAISQFNYILGAFGKTQPLYYKAQWYKALALLKTNHTHNAAQLAKKISRSQSPYKPQATALLAAL